LYKNKTFGIGKIYFNIFIDMKNLLLVLLILSVILFSCARGITPYQAANGKAKCGRYLK
jgi:hypothetical protein